MEIDDDLKRALLHEAGHAVAYYLLQHQSAGIAALKPDLVFCNLVAPNPPPKGGAAGSAAEVLILGNYDASGAGRDRDDLSISEAEYGELVEDVVPMLAPYKRQMRRIQSFLLDSIRWRETLDDFPLIVGPVGGLQPPKDGSACLIMSFDEISAAITNK